MTSFPAPDADASGESSSSEIGSRLREAREQRALTLRDVADASQGSFQVASLSAWERGERRIGLASLMWLADHYGMPVGELLGSRSVGSDRPVLEVRLDALADAASSWDPLRALVERTVAARQEAPRDVVRLRAEDLDFLATVLGLTLPQLVRRLGAAGIATTD